jgi:hypothetical protein
MGMQINKRNLALALTLVLVVFGVLALFYWDFVRDTIAIPIYYMLWVGDLILRSIPHVVYLAFLVLLGLAIAFNTLFGARAKRTVSELDQGQYQMTRYQHWRTLCGGLSVGWFARDMFALESRRLLLAILAYEEGIDVAEVETRVKAGTLPVPPLIAHLIQHKEFEKPKQAVSLMRRLREMFHSAGPQKNLQAERQVAEVISFIEHLLEIDHAGSQSESLS